MRWGVLIEKTPRASRGWFNLEAHAMGKKSFWMAVGATFMGMVAFQVGWPYVRQGLRQIGLVGGSSS